MPGRKQQPVDLILMNGNKPGLTKAEIEQRRRAEKTAIGGMDKIEPPSYLTKKQKDEFQELAVELIRVNIFGNLDIDTLAQYIIARTQYLEVVRELRKLKPTQVRKDEESGDTYTTTVRAWTSLQRSQDLIIRQIRSLASDLGLTLSARMKLVVPQPEDKKESKFARFAGNKNG